MYFNSTGMSYRRVEGLQGELGLKEKEAKDAKWSFGSSVWPETPIRDTSCCCHPLNGVPCLRLGPCRWAGAQRCLSPTGRAAANADTVCLCSPLFLLRNRSK